MVLLKAWRDDDAEEIIWKKTENAIMDIFRGIDI
mgnify:CR=1 FL=1